MIKLRAILLYILCIHIILLSSCASKDDELSALKEQYLDTVNYEPVRLVADIYSGLQRQNLPDGLNIMGTDIKISPTFFDDSLVSILLIALEANSEFDIKPELEKKYGKPKYSEDHVHHWFAKNLHITLSQEEYGKLLSYQDINLYKKSIKGSSHYLESGFYSKSYYELHKDSIDPLVPEL